jgi:hypothetical protein
MSYHADPESRIQLDDQTLEARAKLYPEELREPFIWLGCFIRDECARDLDIMIARAKPLDITFDKTTWSKILRGKWNRDAGDRELANPIVALSKLVKAIDTLRRDIQLQKQAGKIPFIMTPSAQTMFNYFDKKRAVDRVCKFGVLIGETGTGKTATVDEYCLRHNHGACKKVDAPEKPSMYRFITDVGMAYGASIGDNLAKKHAKIRSSFNSRKTLFVENVQRLYDPEVKDGNQPIFSFLQKLQEDTGGTIIISFTPAFEKEFSDGAAKGFFEQFEGRAGGSRTFLRLPTHPTDADVKAIATAFKLRGLSDKTTWGRPDTREKAKTVTVLEYCEMLVRERGRIRILFETLQDAQIYAQSQGEPLDITHIKHVRDED